MAFSDNEIQRYLVERLQSQEMLYKEAPVKVDSRRNSLMLKMIDKEKEDVERRLTLQKQQSSDKHLLRMRSQSEDVDESSPGKSRLLERAPSFKRSSSGRYSQQEVRSKSFKRRDSEGQDESVDKREEEGGAEMKSVIRSKKTSEEEEKKMDKKELLLKKQKVNDKGNNNVLLSSPIGRTLSFKRSVSGNYDIMNEDRQDKSIGKVLCDSKGNDELVNDKNIRNDKELTINSLEEKKMNEKVNSIFPLVSSLIKNQQQLEQEEDYINKINEITIDKKTKGKKNKKGSRKLIELLKLKEEQLRGQGLELSFNPKCTGSPVSTRKTVPSIDKDDNSNESISTSRGPQSPLSKSKLILGNQLEHESTLSVDSTLLRPPYDSGSSFAPQSLILKTRQSNKPSLSTFLSHNRKVYIHICH